MKQYDDGKSIVVYLNGRKALWEDIERFYEDYKRYGKSIVTHKFRAGRFVFLETR